MTPEVLQAATGCRAELAALYAPHFAEACTAYEINTPKRLAAFLAQLSHESGSLRYTKEIWGPTPAQQRYEGRADLGNVRPGDGERFKGHGLIQVTGRFNHARARDRLREKFGDVPDFELHPDELTHPRWAVLSAADFWDSRNLNALADEGDFEAITRKINGGLNGQADRLERWERAKLALQVDAMPESVDQIDISPERVEETPKSVHVPYTPPRPDQEPYTQEQPNMAFPLALVAGLLPSVVELIPSLSKIFKPGSAVAERNVAAASVVLDTVVKATNAVNAQDAIEKMKSDPDALAAAAKEVNSWVEMVEAGGGGIDGARKADAAARSAGDMLTSPSFWALVLLLPLVYMIVGSIAGLWGFADWSTDVRASLATAVVSLIVGGAAGYYWGQTTSRNRTPA